MEISVFTDGSFKKTKDGEFAGYGIYFPNNDLPNMSDSFNIAPITIPRAELAGILVALMIIIKNIKFIKINIYTDSEYSMKTLTEWIYKWDQHNFLKSNKKKVKNMDLIKPIYKILSKYGGMINVIHVKSHTGEKDYMSLNNENADKLAKNGIKNKTSWLTHDIINEFIDTYIEPSKKIARSKTDKNIITSLNSRLNDDYSKIYIKKTDF